MVAMDAHGQGKSGSSSILPTLGLLFLFLVLGLALVWLNIERVDLAYELKKLQSNIEQRKELLAKLQVERDNLASPYRLKPLAKEYGLAEARSGQIRRLTGDDK